MIRLAVLLACASCRFEPFPLHYDGGGGDAGDVGDGGGGDGDRFDGDVGDGLPPGCREETCNGDDDDCDGKIDDGIEGTGEPCGDDTGECRAGTEQCVEAALVCAGEIGPAAEECDGLDNNCNEEVDEVYDFDTDPAHCGGCDPCDTPNATPLCVAGECAIGDCAEGWLDFDGEAANGCEYACTPSGAEVCDGLDNDCDTLTDLADPDFIDLEDNPCVQLGACAGTTPSCGGGDGWVCGYPEGVCPGCPELCDGVDNDCDVAVDEIYGVGAPCSDGGIGACEGTGSYACTADGTDVECLIADPGDPPGTETCNGEDDDCDGDVDEAEDVADAMVLVSFDSLDFYVYAYEASRPDATAASAGVLPSGTRACSVAAVLPWAGLDATEALAACGAAGKHLCTAAEWEAACAGAAASAYPYGDVYDAGACNGDDYDTDGAATGDQDAALATGALAACASAGGAFDLSGNLKEWTDDPFSDGTPPDPDGYRVRGGAYDNVAAGLRCDFDFTLLPPEFAFDNLGFRCCCVVGVDAVCP